MSFIEKQPRKYGDRWDGIWVKDAPALNKIMVHIYPHRTDREVYLQQKFDITELLKFIKTKNKPGAPFKTTPFHCFIAMVARLLNERPYLNRFVQGRRIYQRDEITVSFVAKRRFEDQGEEALMQYKAKSSDTLSDISREIVEKVEKMRNENKTLGINKAIDIVSKFPRPLLMFFIKIVRWLDFWGRVPTALIEGDCDYSSVLLSNLGSIKCPSIYHHLNNYGTNSLFIAIGTIYQTSVVMPNGSEMKRDFIDIGVTLDESIADGFYFAHSLKLIQYICDNPNILDKPLKESTRYEFV